MNLPQKLSADSLAIFLFHGVIESSHSRIRNYTRKHLLKQAFYQFLKELKKVGQPFSLDQVVQYHQENRPYPPHAFAITFDDGFENNFSVAAPMLEALAIPATFYMTSGFVESNAMSWIDRIEYCLEAVPSGKLILPWETESSVFRTPEEQIQLLNRIRHHVKRSPQIDLNGLVSSIFEQCGIPEIEHSSDPLDQKMTWEQVSELHRSDYFTIGGHSHTHAILSFLSPPELKQEVATSLKLLKEKAGIETPHYSYPEGLRHCYSETVIALLKQSGILCCPTAEEGTNRPGDDLFHLKRIMVA